MQDDPETLMKLFERLPPEVTGAIMAIVIALLRLIYDRKETRPARIILEALICGGLSLTVTSAILALNLSSNWAIFAGGSIGYFGSASVRVIALKIINRKFKY